MPNPLTVTIAALAMLTLAPVSPAQPSFQGLGDLVGGAFESSADAISADGTVAVGFGTTGNGPQAFRWTTAGMVGLGFLNGGGGDGSAFAVNADGSVVSGYSDSVNGIEGFRWKAGVMTGIGDLPGAPFGSVAGGITTDGDTIVGIGNLDFANGAGRAIRWTQAGGVQDLGDLAGGISSSTAGAISADGTIIAGTGDFKVNTEGQAFRRLKTGTLVGLGDLPEGLTASFGNALSADGSVVVGLGHSGNGPVAFRWFNGVMKGLGDFAGGAVSSEALGCSADGAVVVGYGTDAGGEKAFYWTQAGGLRKLQDLLIAKGVTGLTGWTLESANACSADGAVIVGYGRNPDNKQEAWIARLSDACTTGTFRASIASPGNGQAQGGSAGGSVTQNGQLVAFESAAANLVANDTNNRTDIFVRNRAANWTTRVSLTSTGFQANNNSWGARINSKDGRFIVFVSAASNLVPGDTNGKPDIFLRDRVANTTELISIGLDGKPGNGASDQPQISSDGRYIAFQSTARNLTQNEDTPFSFSHIFLRDRQAKTTQIVSVGSTGAFATAASGSPSLSNDGRFIAFTTDAANLGLPPDPFDTNGVRDVYVRDRALGKTLRATISTGAAQANGASSLPRLSADGRYVAYTSSAANLVAGDTNARDDVFVHDLVNRSTVRVSLGPAGLQADQGCDTAAISSNGRFILFSSAAATLVPHDTNAVKDAFLHDRWTMKTSRVSVGASNQQAAAACTATALSVDGRTAIFHSTAGNLVGGDAGFSDVFIRDVCR